MQNGLQLIDQWGRRFTHHLTTIFFPGLLALFLIDFNTEIFKGEFVYEELTTFNAFTFYYLEKISSYDYQNFFSTTLSTLLLYICGYFLYSSSKFFAGPRKFQKMFQVSDTDVEQAMLVPESAMNYLGLEHNETNLMAGEEINQTLVKASGIPSKLSAFERKIDLYRSLGYLFSLMVVLDLALFLVSFDFEHIVMKLSLIICNLVLAFLFFKGQQECAGRWKAQLWAETLVAVTQLTGKPR